MTPAAAPPSVTARVERAVRAAGARDCAVVDTAARGTGATCTACGLPDAFPGAALDAAGTCAPCRRFAEHGPAMMSWFGEPDELAPLLRGAAARGGGGPDCLLLFSGGKDSTYVLYRLVDMGLRVMTFTFDNGFISTTALRNVERVTAELGVEHVTMTRADQKEVFRRSLEEHKSVCNGCFRSLLDLSTALAHERGIPTIVTGLSRGQIMDERLSWFHGRGIFDRAEIDRALRLGRQVYHRAGDGAADEALDAVEVVDFYRYSAVTKDGIRALLRARSDLWAQPEDTGFCSSNCIVNDVGVYVHTTERGYHNYEAPTRWEVRLGHLSRAEADAELVVPTDTRKVGRMLAAIGYPDPAGRARPGERLVVHCVPPAGSTVEAVREAAAALLPPELLPARWIAVDRLPRSGGRVDLGALAPPPARTPAPGPRAERDTRATPPTAAQAAVLARHPGAGLARAARAVLLTATGTAATAADLLPATRRAVLALVLHHAALRTRLAAGGLTTAPPAGGRWVVRLDLSGVAPADEPAALHRALDRLRARLDPADGPVLQVAVLDRGARPPALLVLAHTLAVDPRSWPVLLGDLVTALGQVTAGQPVALPPVPPAPAGDPRPGPGAGALGAGALGAGALEVGTALAAALAAAGPLPGLPAAPAVAVLDHTAGPDRPRGVGCVDAPVFVGGPAADGAVPYEHLADPADLLPAGAPFTASDPTGTALAAPGTPGTLSVIGAVRDGVRVLEWRAPADLAARLAAAGILGRLRGAPVTGR